MGKQSKPAARPAAKPEKPAQTASQGPPKSWSWCTIVFLIVPLIIGLVVPPGIFAWQFYMQRPARIYVQEARAPVALETAHPEPFR